MPRSFEHTRRSIRLPGFDYAFAGAYFVTMCAHQREHLFGKIHDGKMELNMIGQILREEWFKTAEIRREIELDEFVIMPNHFHGIVHIHDVGAHGNAPPRFVRLFPSPSPSPSPFPPPSPFPSPSPSPSRDASASGGGAHNHAPLRRPRSLSTWVTGFKWGTTRRINEIRDTPAMKVWQRNYHERIIRDGGELSAIREYIRNNPEKWNEDPDHM